MIVSKSFCKQFLEEGEIQKLQTPGEHCAAEILGNESEHVTKDLHSLFSLGLMSRQTGNSIERDNVSAMYLSNSYS